MPYADYGEEVSFSTSKFNKLKSKGERIRFRLIGKPFYSGKHFLKDAAGDWDIKDCPRINDGGECENCIKFFKEHAKCKKEGVDKKETEKRTSPFKSSVSFYFPIINRLVGEFQVFQTTPGVRGDIEAEKQLGTDVLDVDFDVIRTEKPGNYYKLVRVDSAEALPLSDDELKEIEKGKAINLGDYINGQEEEGDVVEDMEV